MNFEDSVFDRYPALDRDAGRRFRRDGVIDPPTFRSQKRRLLLILKEANSSEPYDKDPPDLREYFRGNPDPRKSTHRNAVHWIRRLLDLEPVEKVNVDILRETLERAAWMNLKKVAGGSKADNAEILSYSHLRRDLIRDQIDVIHPTLILACSSTCDEALQAIHAGREPQVTSRKQSLLQPWSWKETGVPVIPMPHPGGRLRGKGLGLLEERLREANRVGLIDWSSRRISVD